MARRKTVLTEKDLREAGLENPNKPQLPPGTLVEGVHPASHLWFRLTKFDNNTVKIERAAYTALCWEKGKNNPLTFDTWETTEPFDQHQWLFRLIEKNPNSIRHV